MWHRILLIAKRDYTAAVMQKAFLIGMLMPLAMGAFFFALSTVRKSQQGEIRRVAIVDRTGFAALYIVRAAEERTATENAAKQTGANHYILSATEPSTVEEQRLALSAQVRTGELFAFIELEPGKPAVIYAKGNSIASARQWLTDVVNSGFRRARLVRLGIDPAKFAQVFLPVPVKIMNLLAKDPKSGEVRGGGLQDVGIAMAVPLGLMVFMTIITMMGAAPMLTGVAEDKTQRVFEMMLAAATPLDLIAGKVVAAVGCSLTSSAFYLIAGVLALKYYGMLSIIPLGLVPWFFVYLICEVTMLSALGAALGAACSTPRDAQQLVPFVILPVMLPLMMLSTMLEQPNGTLAMSLSLFPPFTPLVMILRQAMPGGVPAWEPWVGLAGILAWTLLATWAAARIFRVAILMQGQPPKIAEVLRWAVRG